MEKPYQHAKSKARKVKWGRNKKGLILRINDRKSSNYYRVSQKNNWLEFELEMKKDGIKSAQNLLFSNCFTEFEDTVSRHFYRHYKNSVVVNTCYTDWLIDKLRKARKKQSVGNSFATTYLTNIQLNSFDEKKRFFHFLQSLSFIQNFKGSKLKDRKVYQIAFPAIDFLRFIGGDDKSHYQHTKILKILRSF